MSAATEQMFPGAVTCVPLTVSTVCKRYGTALMRARRKSAAVRLLTRSCSSTKANLDVRSMPTSR